MTQKSFDQSNLVVLLDPPAAQTSANSSWLQPFADSKGADRAVFMLVSGIVANADVVLALYQATSTGGAGAKAITGATATITNPSTGSIATVEIGPGAMDNDTDASDGNSNYAYVQARVTANSSDVWGLIYIRHNLRYPGRFDQDTTYSSQVRVYD